MKVIWARHARNRLEEIQEFIGRDLGIHASDFCERLIDQTDRLEAHPFRGPTLPEDPAYRQLVVDEYRIVYRVAEDAVYVLTIVAPGMSYENAIQHAV